MRAAPRWQVWSCGVILYAMLCSTLPFDAGDMRDLARQIGTGVPRSPVPRKRGEDARRLVGSLLAVDPAARPAASEALAHDWLKPPVT